ncbi:MAG: CoA-binding protein [Candidatus Rokubacteria bacterium]|nr:CoA-binding protein [Candidatus Rokubacteria bacterium]
MNRLEALFRPRSVAVLGVSRSPEKLGHRLLRNLLDHGFAGELHPVNPGGEPILGRPVVRDARALPTGLDLALVSLPAEAVVEAVLALGEKGCRVAVVLASGFGESGEAGAALENELRAVARRTGMRIVGPNCMGVVNPTARLNGSYFWEVPFRPGGISFVSQSGAYGGLFFREARERGLGVAKFLSIGNQADLTLEEVLGHLGADPETRAIGLFVEAVGDGRAFVEIARRVTAIKPVIALKAGRTEAGRRAAGSHTGALAGVYATYLAAFEAAGVVAARETEELFDGLAALAAAGDRLPEGDAVVILTVSGGPGVVAADCAEASGLRVPQLPDRVRQALRADLPPFGADRNPVDMTPQMDPRRFSIAVLSALGAPGIAGAIAVDVGLDRPEFAEAVLSGARATGKPAVACAVDVPSVAAALAEGGVPCFPTPERAVRAYRALVRYARLRRRPAPVPPRARARPARGLRDPARARGDRGLA